MNSMVSNRTQSSLVNTLLTPPSSPSITHNTAPKRLVNSTKRVVSKRRRHEDRRGRPPRAIFDVEHEATLKTASPLFTHDLQEVRDSVHHCPHQQLLAGISVFDGTLVAEEHVVANKKLKQPSKVDKNQENSPHKSVNNDSTESGQNCHSTVQDAPSSLLKAASHPILPTIYSPKHPDLNVISPETVAKVLRGEFKAQLTHFELLDCRFPYEFQGGSLTGASSLCDPERMETQLFGAPARKDWTRTALIFFCEFSAHRAPKMLRHVRNLDRTLHADCYPALSYPELYLVDGGYKKCFETLQEELCSPCAVYVTMEDERFTDVCRQEFATWRRRWKPHKTVANCAAKLEVAFQVERHKRHEIRPMVSSVRSLFDDLYEG